MLSRRLITIPGYFIAWFMWISAAPIWLVLALITDIVRSRNGVALRSATIVTVYLSCEVIGILASGALWLWRCVSRIEPERWEAIHFRLEEWWGTTLFRAVVWLFRLRLEVENDADLGRGPYFLLLRHSSTADTLLASALVARPHGFQLRYVLKQEHLWDPCLDIVGNRVPNVFVDRYSENSAAEVRRVKELAKDLGPRDGVLIYPEGTRYSRSKRRRVLDRLSRSSESTMFEYAKSLEYVLPPRTGGTLALLAASPESDVVLCEHTGFEGTASLGEIWNGALLNQVVKIRFRRIPRCEVPSERQAQITWLLDEWATVGAWVDQNRSPRTSQQEPSVGSNS